MDAASIENLRQALETEETPGGDDAVYAGIWPEHVAIVDAFLKVCSQWRIVPRSAGGMISPAGGVIAPTIPHLVGLDYAGVRAGLEAEDITITPELWRGLRVMEAAACAAFNEVGN